MVSKKAAANKLFAGSLLLCTKSSLQFSAQ